jgi:hypothetical protein
MNRSDIVPKDELVEGTKYIIVDGGIVFEGIFMETVPFGRVKFRDNMIIRNSLRPLTIEELEEYFDEVENKGLNGKFITVFHFKPHANDTSVAKKISLLRLPNDIKNLIAEMTPSNRFPYNIDVDTYGEFPGLPDDRSSVAKVYFQNHVLRPSVMQSIKEQKGRPNTSRSRRSTRKSVGGKQTRRRRRCN